MDIISSQLIFKQKKKKVQPFNRKEGKLDSLIFSFTWQIVSFWQVKRFFQSTLCVSLLHWSSTLWSCRLPHTYLETSNTYTLTPKEMNKHSVKLITGICWIVVGWVFWGFFFCSHHIGLPNVEALLEWFYWFLRWFAYNFLEANISVFSFLLRGIRLEDYF